MVVGMAVETSSFRDHAYDGRILEFRVVNVFKNVKILDSKNVKLYTVILSHILCRCSTLCGIDSRYGP